MKIAMNTSAHEAGTSASLSIAHLNLPILGMTCGSCVGRVEKALKAVPGVREVKRSKLSRGMDEGVRYQIWKLRQASLVDPDAFCVSWIQWRLRIGYASARALRD